MLTSRELGVSYFVSTGNEAVSGVEDYIGYLLDDPHTRVIGMIVEQFRQPRRFLELAQCARSKGKQIVLLVKSALCDGLRRLSLDGCNRYRWRT